MKEVLLEMTKDNMIFCKYLRNAKTARVLWGGNHFPAEEMEFFFAIEP